MGSWIVAVGARMLVLWRSAGVRIRSTYTEGRLDFRPLLVVLCVGVIGVAPAIGAGQQQPRVPAGALSATDPDFGAGMKRERARAERLRSPEARAERRRSRERHRGLSAAAALDAGQAAFPEEFQAPLFDGARPDPGIRVVRRLRNGAAVAQSASGEKSILQSTVPLETENAAGDVKPVDLSLAADGAGFRTRNALVDLRVSRRSRGGVAFADGGFSVAPGGGSDAAAAESSDRVFFANTQTDADFVVAPRPAGAELAWQLRSPASPERLALDVELPAGAVLRRAQTDHPIPGDPPSAFEIAKGDDAIGYIQPPNAYDADGVPVPSAAAIDGDSIVVTVKHRDGDYRYPLFVDPEVQVKDQHGSNWNGWGTVATPYNPTPNTRNYYGASAANCAYYCGLYLSMPTNHVYSWTGTSIYWQYRAIANTYIYAGTFGGMSHNPTVPFAAYGGPYTTYPYVFSRWYNGIFNGTFTNWEANTNYLNQGGASGPNPFGPHWGGASGVTHAFCLTAPGPRCDRKNTPASDHNALILGLTAQNDLNTADILTGNHRASVTMAWANTYLNDRYNPSMSSPKPADKDWTDDTATPVHQPGTVRAQDAGLGVSRIGLSGGADGTKTATAPCIGDPQRTPCPLDWSTTLPGYRLNEGVNTLSLQATDIVDNQSAVLTWTEKIDRSKPTITEISGALYDARNQAQDHRREGLYDDSYPLRVGATDKHSGVREIEAYVDDKSQRSRGGYTANGSLDWNMRPDHYSDGEHTIKIVVRDRIAGQPGAVDERHIDRAEFKVVVDRRGDIYRATEYSDNPATGGEAGAREAVRVGTAVSRSDDGTSITTRANVPCTDGATSGPLCAEWRARSYENLEGQDYTVYRGSSTDDPRVRDAAYLASTRNFRTDQATSTGSSLISVLEPWQVRPPAAGATVEVHEVKEALRTNADPGGDADERADPGQTEENVIVRVWLDSASRLPVRSEVRAPDGTLVDRLYWAYDVSRLESSEVPQDYFTVGSPLSPGVDERVQMRGNQTMDPQTDTETGKTIRPWNLGALGQLLLGPTLCLIDRHVVRVTETRAGDSGTLSGGDAADPLQPVTVLGAAYDFVDNGGTCTPGKGSLDNPAVTIEVAHRDSTLAQLWRQQQIDEATAIQANPTSDDFLLGGLIPVVIDASPTVAYVTTLAENTIAALVERGDDVIMIKGEITKLQLPLVAALLRKS